MIGHWRETGAILRNCFLLFYFFTISLLLCDERHLPCAHFSTLPLPGLQSSHSVISLWYVHSGYFSENHPCWRFFSIAPSEEVTRKWWGIDERKHLGTLSWKFVLFLLLMFCFIALFFPTFRPRSWPTFALQRLEVVTQLADTSSYFCFFFLLLFSFTSWMCSVISELRHRYDLLSNR